jgi:SAM-dependent methyltransferase
MVAMPKQFFSITDLVSGVLNSDRWEAPERGFPGHRDILVQSRARYEFVAPHVRGTLLDVGCGRGYGFEVLAPKSDKQFGIDISPMFLKEARRLFPGIWFACANGDALPVASSSFDTILAFEVIEHAENDQVFLDELKRVARRDALIALSTPNRLISSGDREKPLNRFHNREYTPGEFGKLLKGKFSSVELFGQYERLNNESSRNNFVDRIPIRWKYLVPHLLQTMASVVLRPPLRLEECKFQSSSLEKAPTFLALCRC